LHRHTAQRIVAPNKGHFMDEGQIKTVEARKLKDSIFKEILVAYRESGALYKKIGDPESRQAHLDMKRGFDLILQRLSPSEACPEKLWEELKPPFSG
jgi:hypothetical protein